MGSKGNLAVFESSNISETGEVMATKTGVHALDIDPYLHDYTCIILFNFNFQYSTVHASLLWVQVGF